MATELVLPRQGQSVESCIILSWKKGVGDPVREGEVVAEVETDKATFEVEATSSGTLLKRYYEEGDDVPVLSVLAMIGDPGESVPDSPSAAHGGDEEAGKDGGVPAPKAAPTAAPKDAAPPVAQPAGRDDGEHKGVSPRARNLAAAAGIDPTGLQGTGPGGRVIERDVTARMGSSAPATPAAIAEMVARGKEAPATGTGVGGRVTTADLRDTGMVPGEAPARRAGATMGAPDFPGDTKDEAVKGIRKVIAERMQASLAKTAQLSMHAAADARSLMAWRARFKASGQAKGPDLGLSGITINDLVLFVVSRSLSAYPEMNAHFLGDRIRRFDEVHLGFAVDTPRGLMVPTIRFANRLSLRAISAEAKRLGAACQEGTATADELGGATFTITNLGNLGIEYFTPVLNPPQVGILGVGSIQPKATLVDEETVFVPSIGYSLTIDHQAVDGAPAGRYLQYLCRLTAGLEMAFAL